MRTRFSNTQEAAHVWAAGTQYDGRSGNVFFRDRTLYSYGEHFPVGRIYRGEQGERVALFNAASYSVSTSRHQQQARHAWEGNGPRLTCAVSLWPTGDTITQAQLVEIETEQAKLDAANREAEKIHKREQARAARARKKLEKMADAERLTAWKAGERITLPYNTPIALRYVDSGRTVETSRRATVPTVIALMAWRAYERGTLAAGHRVGAYRVDSVSADAVKIGCHVFPAETLREFFPA